MAILADTAGSTLPPLRGAIPVGRGCLHRAYPPVAVDQGAVGDDNSVHVAERGVGPETEQPEQFGRRLFVQLVEQRQGEVLLRADPRAAEVAEQQVPSARSAVGAGAVPQAPVRTSPSSPPARWRRCFPPPACPPAAPATGGCPAPTAFRRSLPSGPPASRPC